MKMYGEEVKVQLLVLDGGEVHAPGVLFPGE